MKTTDSTNKDGREPGLSVTASSALLQELRSLEMDDGSWAAGGHWKKARAWAKKRIAAIKSELEHRASNTPGTREYAQRNAEFFTAENPDWEMAIKCDEGWWYVDFPPSNPVSETAKPDSL